MNRLLRSFIRQADLCFREQRRQTNITVEDSIQLPQTEKDNNNLSQISNRQTDVFSLRDRHTRT
jgi:hypothetical protein